MIHYQLRCSVGHEFDSWFKDSGSFEKQAKAGFVECPACGSTDVSRALMAPAIAKASGVKGRPEAVPASPPAAAPTAAPPPQAASAGPMPAQVQALLQRMRSEVEKNCDYVGTEFAEEARKMHRGESDRRGIYGETSESEAESLRDEGIEVARLPWVPLSDA